MLKNYNFKDIFKGRLKFVIGFLIIVVAASAYWFFGRNSGVAEVLVVKSQPFTQTVMVSGETKAASFVDLAFEQGGRVAAVSADVGDRVASGQTLVSLDGSQAKADLLSAEANLEYEKATFYNAQVSLVDATDGLKNSLRNSYTTSDDAIKNHVNKLFRDANSISSRFDVSLVDNGRPVNFDLADSNLKVSLVEKQRAANILLIDWNKNLNDPNFFTNQDRAISLTLTNLNTVRDLLDATSRAINSLSTSDSQDKSILDGYKTDIATTRTNIDNAISALTTAKQTWNTANLNAASSNDNRPSTQSAQIKQAEAKVLEQKALVGKLSLVAPISGLVTKQEARVGEQVSAGAVVTSVIATDSFEVEANIPEINIGKIKVGQTVDVTFDAFPGEKFSGKVFYIDPAETIVDGVVNYKIKVSFDKSDNKIKSGLTANLAINIFKKDTAIVIPVYAVTTEKGQAKVEKYVDGKTVSTNITLGAYGDDGLVEVLSGLVVNDKIAGVKK